MKKIILLLASLSFSLLISAQTEFTSQKGDVNVEEKKKLTEYFDSFEVINIDILQFKKLLKEGKFNFSLKLDSKIIKDS